MDYFPEPGDTCYLGRDFNGNGNGTVVHDANCAEFSDGTITDIATGKIIAGSNKE